MKQDLTKEKFTGETMENKTLAKHEESKSTKIGE